MKRQFYRWFALMLVTVMLCGVLADSLAEENTVPLVDMIHQMVMNGEIVVSPTAVPQARRLEGEYALTVRNGYDKSGDELTAEAVSVLRKRLEVYGIRDAEVQSTGTGRISVIIPDASDEQIRDLIREEGRMEFVDEDGNVFLTHDMIQEASCNNYYGEWTLTCMLTDAGKSALREAVSVGAGKIFNIRLNNKDMISRVPFERMETVAEAGSFTINNMESAARTNLVCAWLSTQPMPADLTVVSIRETDPDTAARESLEAFFSAWKAEDYAAMQKKCSYEWNKAMGIPDMILVMMFSGLKLTDYSVLTIEGTENEAARTITAEAMIRTDNHDTPEKHRFRILMTEDVDGRWYVDPSPFYSETTETGE